MSQGNSFYGKIYWQKKLFQYLHLPAQHTLKWDMRYTYEQQIACQDIRSIAL